MEISHTDPSSIAVPFAEVVQAATAWGDAGRLLDDCALETRTQGTACFGPQVGPFLAERIARWQGEIARLGDAAAEHAAALRACVATLESVDADAARSFG